jgi:CheY-like chemotaxis protein
MSQLNVHTVMIIDDDTDDSELFCETVYEINSNIICLVAANGLEALLLLKKTDPSPDIIFLDLNMPRMSGKQCLAEIKKHETLREIPVIIYTTSKIQDDVNETKELGAFDFITKPFRSADIKKAVLRILDNIYMLKRS